MDIEYLMADNTAGGLIIAIIIVGGIIALFVFLYLSADDAQEEEPEMKSEFIPNFGKEEATDFIIDDIRKQAKEKGLPDELNENKLKDFFPEGYKPPKE